MGHSKTCRFPFIRPVVPPVTKWARRWLSEDFQHLAGKDPIVPVQNSRAWFGDEAGHGKAENVERSTSNIECRNLLDVRRSALDVRRSEMQLAPQASIDLPGVKKLRSGEVREVFDLGETLLFVATDRLSAFDVILPDPIPHKGAVLNQLSAFWFKRFDNIENHFVTANFDEFPKNLQPFRAQLAGRSMIVRKTKPLPVECVVRGYLTGSGWKELSGIAKRVRRKIAAGIATRLAIARTNFHASDKERHRPRSQH
jgi:hypothetical protein